LDSITHKFLRINLRSIVQHNTRLNRKLVLEQRFIGFNIISFNAPQRSKKQLTGILKFNITLLQKCIEEK